MALSTKLPKVIFFDIDGTTYYNPEHRVFESTMEALKLLKKADVKLFICTSRAREEMCMLPKDFLALFDGYVTTAGSLIYINNEVYHRSTMDDTAVQLVIKKLEELNLVYRWLSEDGECFISKVDANKMEIFSSLYQYVPAVKGYQGQALCHLLFYIPNHEIMTILEPLLETMHVIDLGLTKELVLKGVSKAYGMRVVAEYYNTTLAEVAAFGDAYNDIEMLQQANVGIAMGNAKEAVKTYADYVTDNIEDDGLYNACRHFNWI